MVVKAGTKMIPLRLPLEFKEQIVAAAKADGRTVNAWILRQLASILNKEA